MLLPITGTRELKIVIIVFGCYHYHHTFEEFRLENPFSSLLHHGVAHHPFHSHSGPHD